MVYDITPGMNFPYLIKGDVCNIDGIDYLFIGDVKSKTELPVGQINVVYRIENDGIQRYYLRHQKSEAVGKKFNQSIIQHIANDTSPVIRERVNKVVFTVPIEAEDNYLKVRVKQIINHMQIDIRDYKDRFGSDNRMNNMRRLLTGPANLTYEKFLEWLDILGYTHDMTIYDTDGKIFKCEGTK